MKVLQSVKRAALFLADVLSSGSFTAQLKKHGIKDRKYKARLEERLRTEYTLDPPVRAAQESTQLSSWQLGRRLSLGQPRPSTAELSWCST